MALLRKRNGDPIVEAEELSANLRHCRAGARCSPIGWYPPRRNCARPSMAADKRCSTRISMMQLPQLDAPRRRLHRLELSAMTTRKSPGVRPGQGQSQPIRRLTRDRHDTQALRCYRVQRSCSLGNGFPTIPNILACDVKSREFFGGFSRVDGFLVDSARVVTLLAVATSIDRGDRAHAGFAFNGCTITFATARRLFVFTERAF